MNLQDYFLPGVSIDSIEEKILTFWDIFNLKRYCNSLNNHFIFQARPRPTDVVYGSASKRRFLMQRYPGVLDQHESTIDVYSIYDTEKGLEDQTNWRIETLNDGDHHNDTEFSKSFAKHLKSLPKGREIVNQNAYWTASPGLTKDEVNRLDIASRSIFRRKCKLGLDWLVTKMKRNVHFVLTGLDMNTVVNKGGFSRNLGNEPQSLGLDWNNKFRIITHSELRSIYRHREVQAYQERIQFWNHNKIIAKALESIYERLDFSIDVDLINQFSLVPVVPPWVHDRTKTNSDSDPTSWLGAPGANKAWLIRFRATTESALKSYHRRLFKNRSSQSKSAAAYLKKLIKDNDSVALVRATCFFIGRSPTEVFTVVDKPSNFPSNPKENGKLVTQLREDLLAGGLIHKELYEPQYSNELAGH